MKRVIRDGWHTVAGDEVLIENGEVVRGVGRNGEGQLVPLYVYRWDSCLRCWIYNGRTKYETFRSGIRRGNMRLG